MASRSVWLLFALVSLATIAHAARRNDPFMEGVFQTRRTANGVMGGYAGVSRRGYPMAIAGGFATHHSPSYAAASEEDEVVDDMEEQPMEDEEEEQQDDIEEPEEPVKPAPVKPKRPSRRRPQRPRQDEEDDETVGGGGGVSAIATSYSNGKGAMSKSHAVAYGGGYSGGQFKHR